MVRWLPTLLLLATPSCSDPGQVESREEQVASAKPASSPETKPASPGAKPAPGADFVASNTSEELALAASRICLPQVTKEGGVAVADLEKRLTGHGYKLDSSRISRQLFGREVTGFVAARKSSKLGRFLVAFGGTLPGCVVLLTDDSTVPPVKDVRKAFESQGWEWAYMAAKRPDPLPYAGFKSTDKNGKTILAVLRDEPTSDRSVRLGIEINYTTF
jgi:hypothetical protein